MSLHKPKSVRFLNLNHEKYFEEYSGRKLEEEEEKKEQASNNFPAFLYTGWLAVISEPLFPHWACIISPKYSNILKLKVLKILFNCKVADTPGH